MKFRNAVFWFVDELLSSQASQLFTLADFLLLIRNTIKRSIVSLLQNASNSENFHRLISSFHLSIDSSYAVSSSSWFLKDVAKYARRMKKEKKENIVYTNQWRKRFQRSLFELYRIVRNYFNSKLENIESFTIDLYLHRIIF